MFMLTLTEIGKMDHNFKDILHNVNLTEGQIGVILCSLEKSVKYASKKYITENIDEIDSIFEELEGSVDRYYDKIEKAQAKQPIGEW